MVGIYKITNPNNKIYIGQSINIEKRFKSYKNLQCKTQIALYSSFKKYGIENHKFEIIEVCDFNMLNEKERFYQDFFNCISNKNLNCKLTKTTLNKGVMSEDTKKRISKSNTGKKRSEEHILILKTNWLGKKHSLESINKMKKNNARANLGKKASVETRKKISENNSRYKSKKVLNVETGIFYDSIRDACKSTNYKYEYIKTNLNGTTLKNRTNFILI